MTNLYEPHRSHEQAAIAALAAISARYNAMIASDNDADTARWMLVARDCVESAEMYSRAATRYEALAGSVFPGVRP